MNNTDNKKVKKILLLFFILAILVVVGIVLFVVINNRNNNDGSTVLDGKDTKERALEYKNERDKIIKEYEEKMKKDNDKSETKQDNNEELTKDVLIKMAGSMIPYLEIGSKYTTLKDVPNENIAYFIEGNTIAEGIEYGYFVSPSHYIIYCGISDCPEDSIFSENIDYISAKGINRGYLFDRIRELAKDSFNRNVTSDDIQGDYLRLYFNDNKDYIVDSNEDYIGTISINSVESIKDIDETTKMVVFKLNDSENRYSSLSLSFKTPNKSYMEYLNLTYMNILSIEIK